MRPGGVPIGKAMPSPLETTLQYTFQNPKLLDQALTHSSLGHEQKMRLPHNERMEFLGDAVLALVIAEHLYQLHPDLPEGHLTKVRSHLVNRAALAEIAQSLDLGPHLRLGRAEATQGGRQRASNLANAMEAIIAAIFLDSGYNAARDLVLRLVGPRLGKIAENPEPENAKGLLQEKLHAVGKQAVYRLVSETGPAHRREFESAVEVDGQPMGTGTGATKKEAETRAAASALKLLP